MLKRVLDLLYSRFAIDKIVRVYKPNPILLGYFVDICRFVDGEDVPVRVNATASSL
jgi:hypothetical protein